MFEDKELRKQMTKEYDPSELTFEQLRVRHWSGKDTVSGVGRYKSHTYHHYAVTALGEIELAQWRKLAKELIARNNEQDLQANLLEWEREHNYTRMQPTALELESLDLHVSRIFDNPLWVYFVPFNQRYRPEVIEEAHLVWVKNVCCDEPGQTTQEQVDAAREHDGSKIIACPCCGRWSAFEVIEDQTKELATEMTYTL